MKKVILILSVFTLSCATKVDTLIGTWRILKTVNNTTGEVIQDGKNRIIFLNDGTYAYSKAATALPYEFDANNIYFGSHSFEYVINDYSLVIDGYIPNDTIINTDNYTTYLYKY